MNQNIRAVLKIHCLHDVKGLTCGIESVVFIHTKMRGGNKMGTAIKKTISLPPKLAKRLKTYPARKENL